MSISFHYLLKYIVIGDSAVGKSNLLLRYAHDRFNDEYQATIGVEFGAKNVEINDQIYRIQIWDTAGQENFRSITRAYYKNSVCALVVYDITNRESFNHIQSWIEDCKSQSPKTVILVLVGNKSDLNSERQVNYDEGMELANKNKMIFYETSAKTGSNVEDIFLKSAENISNRIKEGYYDLTNDSCGIKQGINSSTPTSIISLDENDDEPKKKICCK